MEVGVLGPLQVKVGGNPIVIAGARLRSLLLRLAVEPGRRVSVTELAAAVWGDDQPTDPANAVQSLVSRLRRVLPEPEAIKQHSAGYELALSSQELDATRFSELVIGGKAQLRQGDLGGAANTLTHALALWRGPALLDAGDSAWAEAYAARWEESRLSATSDLITIALRRGRAAEVVVDLEELVTAHPLRESFTVQLMTALAASGRTAEALERYEQTRQYLAETLGTDPGTELQQLHLALLRGDADLPAAPPSATGRRRTNLRSALTSFVGRDNELDRVSSMLAAGRLTTIVGAGGAGKTRLAAEAAQVWLERTGDPAWLVELAPVTSEANIAPTVLSALGIRDGRLIDRAERPQHGDEERLLDALADSSCLIVVDNCEHLIEPIAQLVDDILARAPGVRILATSREPLVITGEILCAIGPLSLPKPDASLAHAALSPSVILWVDRARAVSPDFLLTKSNLEPVLSIVRRLDGLPLAIELAAARLRVLPLAEISSRLSDRFRLLTGGNRTSLPRHRTLRAVVEWSWDLLTPAERLLAERLAVFPAGASVDGAIAVCADAVLTTVDGSQAADVPDLLTSLVDKSLLLNGETLPVRYRMLETIREYGMERLTERGDIHAVRTAHADYFAQLVDRLEPLLHGDGQLTALETLNTEHDNVVAALRYYGDSGRPADAMSLALGLVWYWSLLGSNTEAVAWLSFVIDANQGVGHPALAYAEAARAIARASSRTAGDDWSQLQSECLDIVARLNSGVEPPYPSLLALGPIVGLFSGRSELAEQLMDEALQSSDRWVRAVIHAWSANVGENNGDLDRVRRESVLALEEFSQLGDRWGLSTALASRAHVATLEGDIPAAITDFETALGYVTELGATDDDLYLLLRLAGLHLRQGHPDAARRNLELLRERSQDVPLGAEREIFADSMLASVLWQEGRLAEALALTTQLRHRVYDQDVPSPFQGHTFAIVSSMAANMSADSGDAQTALTDAGRAYPVALTTTDMPIIAGVGVAVAHIAEVLGDAVLAAQMLGAAAQVRGGGDPTDPQISSLTSRLRERLGDGFGSAYAAGAQLSRAEALARLDPAQLTR